MTFKILLSLISLQIFRTKSLESDILKKQIQIETANILENIITIKYIASIYIYYLLQTIVPKLFQHLKIAII